MESMLQVDKIMSEVRELGEKEKIALYYEIEKMFDDFNRQRDNDVSVTSVFGLWKNRDIDKDTLRKKAWAKFELFS